MHSHVWAFPVWKLYQEKNSNKTDVQGSFGPEVISLWLKSLFIDKTALPHIWVV